VSWQLGLNEREINQILRGDTAAKARPNKPLTKSQNVAASSDNNGQVEQRPITEIDVCPICQDELLAKKLPVSYCRYIKNLTSMNNKRLLATNKSIF
jgi:E3 ubiquitin-protein ligase ZSWIM2